MPARAALLAAALLLLAGCSDAPAPGAAGEAAAPGGEAGGPVTEVAAPRWQVGQWWEWETTFADGTSDETFRSVVVSTGSEHVLAADRDGMAKEAAAFGHPLLSPVRASDLAMGGWGDAPWSLLSFPLTDGKAWTATLPNVAWDVFLPATTVEATMTATFAEAEAGQAPVVRLAGTAQDLLLLEAEYDPASGWFRSLTFHDVDEGDDPLEVAWRAVASGLNFTEPVHQAQATLLLAFEDLVGFSNVPTEGGHPYTQPPQPYHAFTMGGGTSLYGFVGGASVAGARGLVLVDPANQERHLAVTGTPNGESFLFIDEPGQAGEWRLATAGAGGFSGAFAELYEITATQATLAAAPPPAA